MDSTTGTTIQLYYVPYGVIRRANNFESSAIEPLNPYVGFAAGETILMYWLYNYLHFLYRKAISKSDIL
jgi:hypothetical protein